MKVIITIIMLISSLATMAHAEITVAVGAEVSVNSDVLTLGAIATLNGADATTLDSLSRIRLGFSPMPGNWRELDRGVIASQLQLNGFSSAAIRIQAPEKIRIFRASQMIDAEMLKTRLTDYIYANAPWSAEEMTVGSISNPGTVAVSQGHLDMEFIPRGTCNYLGPETFIVQLRVDGQDSSRVLMTANIRVLRETLVASRTIQARELISPADVELRRMDISDTNGDVALNMDEVVGMEARGYIRPGQVISRRLVSMPLLVKRGELVSLKAVSDGFVIQTKGVAQQNGRKGDVIRILNPTSKKLVEALVTGPQAVEIIF